MKRCVYCQKENVKFSKEHIISESVLIEAFGKEKRNISRLYGKKMIDTEHTIKDVCAVCNSGLSSYDLAGKNLIAMLKPYFRSKDIILPTDYDTINWIIKTHLNQLRVIPDRQTNEKYYVDSRIYNTIHTHRPFMEGLCKLYVSGWEGLEYFWDENSEKRIQYFSYKSVRFLSQKMIVSNFRFKFIDTFLFLPYRQDYEDFDSRIDSVLNEMNECFGFDLQEISIVKPTGVPMNITKVVPSDVLLKIIRKIE